MPIAPIALIALNFSPMMPVVVARPFDAPRLSISALAAVTGRAGPTTRLSVFTNEITTVQGQLVAENMRAAFDVWFADNNVQQAANTALLR